MQLEKITVQNFRSYENAEFAFQPGINLVTGPNGVGKTNLLEAVFVAMRGGSFRVGDKDLPRVGSEWFRVDVELSTQTRAILYERSASATKRLIINGGAKKPFRREHRLPVVLFEPDMLRSLSGSPARRGAMCENCVAGLLVTEVFCAGGPSRGVRV